MNFLNAIKFLILALICTSSLIACSDKGRYYEYFHDIDLNKQNRFTFNATPKSNKAYRVMLVLYPKNQQEREKVFDYSDMIATTRTPLPNETYAIIKIKNKKNEVIYNEASDIHISAYDNKKLNCYLIDNPIKLEKNQNYVVEVEFKNLNTYPLSHIESKLAFGLGQYYEPNPFH